LKRGMEEVKQRLARLEKTCIEDTDALYKEDSYLRKRFGDLEKRVKTLEFKTIAPQKVRASRA